MRRILLASVMLSSFVFGGVNLTIYSEGLGLINETRTVFVPSDTGVVDITGVAEKIDPTSVRIDIPGVTVLEENYVYDVASLNSLLQKMKGKVIDVVLKGGTVLSGTLLNYDTGAIILAQEGRISVIKRSNVVQVNLSSLPKGLVTEPTLELRTASPDSGHKNLRLSYLTGGLNWQAEYVGVMEGDSLSFNAWISIDNQSGADYRDVKIKLVAGKIRKIQQVPQQPLYQPIKAAAVPEKNAPPVTSGKLFEYHTYTLNFLTTLKNNEKKQVNFISGKKVKYEKIYQYDGRGENVKVILKFKNDKTQGLGVALPEGIVKIFKVDKDGTKEFIGEDKINHTPAGGEVNLYVGDAFDIKAKRTILKRYKLSEREQEQDIKVVINNFKDKDVTVHVIDHFYGFWEIVQSTHAPKLKDAYTVEFVVPVKAHNKAELVYRVRQTW